jgi:ATP-dependent DNA helicase RecG
MTDAQLSALLTELLSLPKESEWVEFKHNYASPDGIAEYLSALPNAAALHGRDFAYIVWGVEDGTHNVVGTTFNPQQAKKGNEELENWLMRSLHPQVEFKMHQWEYQTHPVVLCEIPRASHAPVRCGTEAFIRVGSLKKKLKDYPHKERDLWKTFDQTPFEDGIARSDLAADEVQKLLDTASCFDLLKIPQPTTQTGVLEKLADERLIVVQPGGRYDITNLGGILFAKDLARFDRLGRKALRILKYQGDGRTSLEREWRDAPSQRGYALAFEPAVAFINSQLPQKEPIGQAFRTEARMYPEIAIRELVANALIHQDFSVTGAGPMVQMFDQRMEITNPGEPLVDTLRFLDTPPRSRNESLAAMMRRMGICEEGGSGIDKAVESIEVFQLPALEFSAPLGNTTATLFGPKALKDMDAQERIRACYQHCCLMFVSGKRMTNSSLRERLGVEKQNYAAVSRVIREATDRKMVRPFDPDAGKRYMQYVPFWG